MASPLLSEIFDRNRNSFGLVRLWAALAVVVSHAFVPAVAVYALVFGLLIAPAISSRSALEVLTSPDLAAFLARTLAFAPGNPPRPGGFEANPLPGIVNEPLWTVKYEILCDLALAACGGLAARWGRIALLAVAGTVIALYVATTIVVPVALAGTPGTREEPARRVSAEPLVADAPLERSRRLERPMVPGGFR